MMPLIMLELEAAQERILSFVQPLGGETLPLSAALGRFLAERIVSPIDIPPFHNSAMDGYAVRAEDVSQATSQAPVTLRLASKVAAGESAVTDVLPGACVRVFTGSLMPPRADAVVMQEDTVVDASRPESVQILDAAKPWENVRFRGEDVRAGSSIIDAGELLNAARLGLLAATGRAEIKVGRRPTVALVATGSELVEAGARLKPGQIYESNRVALAALADQASTFTNVFPLVPDDLAATTRLIEKALSQCDVLVTCGGVSVGEFDFVKKALSDLGAKLDFWRVAIKPGKPFVFGTCRNKLIFGLPGNPVSAFVTFLLLVRPALLRLQGAKHWTLPQQTGVLMEPLANDGDRRHFLRVVVNPDGDVQLAGTQASHVLGSLSSANGLIDLLPAQSLAKGETVRVLRWD